VAEEEFQPMQPTRDEREAIEAASRCYVACAETLSYSLDGSGLGYAPHVRLLIDCGDILQTTQNAMLRGSQLSMMFAAVCVEACERVAESCRSIDGSDPQLLACAEACDETADCCRRLAI
jgi:hypothetical protein